MTQPDNPSGNPLEGLLGGAGGFDMNALLAQAQQMQAQLEQAQAQLGEATIEGSAGGGAVTVTVTGTGELAGVSIRPGSFDGSSADDLSDVGDLVVAAYRDAKTNADALAAEKLGPLAGGLGGMPGGGALPGGPAGF